ncbi:Hypothetical protein NCS54_01385200 [Fusarium falciforme]|uniref:Hypothetical protein n=1 Tax=Fusarium falciforme TaxID=195108 RepID=UPI0023017082|nr:Hypothetical protein NCS54_01385200 [Fusarium falciforme]WAO96187.1 Hypothetical protein NCS54_01385200 [Fusarium falciforme]
MAAAGPCYVSGTTTALTSETTTATTSSFYNSETASTSATLTTVGSETTSTTATLSTESTETASTTATLTTSSTETASTTATFSSEIESTSATITTFSSTESASTATSATTTSSAAPDPDCYKHIKILWGQAIGGVDFYGDNMTLGECLDTCTNAGNCIAFTYRTLGNECYVSYTGEEGNLWGPLDDDSYDSGYTNTC